MYCQQVFTGHLHQEKLVPNLLSSWVNMGQRVQLSNPNSESGSGSQPSNQTPQPCCYIYSKPG